MAGMQGIGEANNAGIDGIGPRRPSLGPVKAIKGPPAAGLPFSKRGKGAAGPGTVILFISALFISARTRRGAINFVSVTQSREPYACGYITVDLLKT